MDNFGKLFQQAIQKDPLHVTMGYKKKCGDDSSVYPLLPRYPNTNDIRYYTKRLIAFHSELAQTEIQIQHRNTLIANQKCRDLLERMTMAQWSMEQISNLKIDTVERYIHIWKTLREIEWGIPIGSIQFAQKEQYKKARESYQTVLNIIFTQIEIGKIISDDTEE